MAALASKSALVARPSAKVQRRAVVAKASTRPLWLPGSTPPAWLDGGFLHLQQMFRTLMVPFP